MDVQVQVAGQITSKPTSTGGQKFDIPLSNGMKASTFDVALATKVSQFGGAVFTARLEQKPNPRGGNPYTNITAAAGPGETLTPEIPQAGTPIGQTFTPAAQTFVPNGGSATPIVAAGTNSNGSKKFTEADTIRITKLSSISTAYQLVSALFHGAGPEALDEVVAKADSLARKLYADARSHEPGSVPSQPAEQPQAAVAADPASVAAYVAENAGQPVVQVGVAEIEAQSRTEAATALPWS